MSKPKEDWFYSAKQAIKNYPARKAEYDELHKQALAFQMTGVPSGCDTSRTVENIALRQMAPMKQIEYDAVTKAISVTKMLPNGDNRVELIERMYWRGKKTDMKYIAPIVYAAEATAWRWHGAFVRLVGEFMGYKI